jgi:hypothetical protein
MLYLLLAATGISMLLISWRHRVEPGQLGLLLITGAAIGTVDLILKGLLGAYTFHPGLLSLPQDSYLGCVLAELIFVPAAFASLAGFSAGNVALVVSMVALEYLFVLAGAFKHNGWELWMTVLAFAIYAWGVTRWLRSFERKGYDATHRAILVVAIVIYAWHLWTLVAHRLIRWLDLTLPLPIPVEPNQVLGSTLIHGIPSDPAWGRSGLVSLGSAAGVAIGIGRGVRRVAVPAALGWSAGAVGALEHSCRGVRIWPGLGRVCSGRPVVRTGAGVWAPCVKATPQRGSPVFC